MSIASTSISLHPQSSRSPEDNSMPPVLSRINQMPEELVDEDDRDENEPSSSSAFLDEKPKLEPQDGYFLELRTINAHITCPLCQGYFVEATTVVDCLHTFCKSCLLQHFEEVDNCCPKCNSLIHQSHPSHYVSFDRTMQDIVYKLVPGMQSTEIRLRREFASSLESSLDGEQEGEEKKEDVEDAPGTSFAEERTETANTSDGLEEGEIGENGDADELQEEGALQIVEPSENGDEIPDLQEETTINEQNTENIENVENVEVPEASASEDRCCIEDDRRTAHHRGDDSMPIILKAGEEFSHSVDRPVLWISGLATINTIKRYLAMVLLDDVSKYNEFDLFCNNELMGRDFSMKFIRLTRWRNKADNPLVLIYKNHIEY